MRKFLTFFIGCALGLQSVNAQVNINLNIGSQPQWGPSGYNHVDYYYLPDIQTYYSVPRRQFIYLNNGNWVFSNYLPARYSSYNLYNGYKVVLNTVQPYRYFDEHKVRYAKYKGLRGQQLTIRGKAKGKTHLASNKPPKSYVSRSGGSKSFTANRGNYKLAGNSKGNGGNGKGNNSGKGHGGGKGKHQ